MDKDIKQLLYSKCDLIEDYYDNITDSDIEMVINGMSDFNPKIIEETLSVDNEKLFNREVCDIVDYLSSYKDCKLHKKNSNYYCDYFYFTRKRLETQDELINRLYYYVENACKAIHRQKNKLSILKEERDKIYKKLDKLNKQIDEINYEREY